MKINDLIKSFEIYTTNEEKALLEEIDKPLPLDMFDERSQTIIQSLIRKSCITKIISNNRIYIAKNQGF